MELLYFIRLVLVEWFGLLIAYFFAGIFIYLILRKLHSRKIAVTFMLVLVGVSIFFYAPKGLPHGIGSPLFLTTYGPAGGPVLPVKNVIEFFKNFSNFPRVADIARDPNDVPAPISRAKPETVEVALTAKEVISELAPGVFENFWTFDGTIPGPMIRVREGDTVKLTLKNDATNLHPHNIDLHAISGPGGGAVSTTVKPGESKTVTFKVLHPGLFVYHCAFPNAANHMAHGMYGMILVEPAGGLAKVDKEYYVMQGESYTSGELGRKGLQVFDTEAMLNGKPQYIVFNGRVGGINGKMAIETNKKVRIFFGNGGVNLISSFHVIGGIFDKVYPEGSLNSATFKDVQTTLVPAGGATAVELSFPVPGNYMIVDHALSRIDRGAWGMIKVSGMQNKEIYDGEIPSTSMTGH